jgi:hypothetical protein
MYASFSGYDDTLFAGGFGVSDSASVPLEDYDYRDLNR